MESGNGNPGSQSGITLARSTAVRHRAGSWNFEEQPHHFNYEQQSGAVKKFKRWIASDFFHLSVGCQLSSVLLFA
jgi:hypothetical protein